MKLGRRLAYLGLAFIVFLAANLAETKLSKRSAPRY